MKFTNDLVAKFGTDKLLHFLVGALVTAIGFLFSFKVGFLMGIVIILANVAKEYMCDDQADTKEIVACCIGVVTSVVFALLSLIF